MNILLTTDPIGGVWTFTAELARELSAAGHRVLLASIGGWVSRSQFADVSTLANVQLHQRPDKIEWMDEPWGDVARTTRWLVALARDFGADVAHLNQFCYAAGSWPCPVLTTGHSCVLSWWRSVKGEPAGPRWARYRRHVRRGLGASDHVTAPTNWMLWQLQLHYGPLMNCSVVPNGRRVPSRPASSKSPLVFAAGRMWDEGKNLSALRAISGRIGWTVCVAGDCGTSREPRRGLRMLGRLSPSATADWMARSAIYALPARYEPFGLSVLEAALNRCALVLGDVESLRENWSGAAIFVDPGDAGALAEAVNTLIGRPRMRERLARWAAARAGQLTSDATADAYVRLYRHLMGRPAAAIAARSREDSKCLAD